MLGVYVAAFVSSLWVCLGVSLAGSASLAGPVNAWADPPVYSAPTADATEPDFPALSDCPAGGLSAYGGSDDAAAELRQLRNELAAVCAALTDRQDETAHRLWWVVAEALAASGQRSTGNALLNDLKSNTSPPVDVALPGVTAKDPLPVSDAASQQYSDQVASAVDASGTATKGAVWFLAGAVAACFVGFLIYRQVMPRA